MPLAPASLMRSLPAWLRRALSGCRPGPIARGCFRPWRMGVPGVLRHRACLIRRPLGAVLRRCRRPSFGLLLLLVLPRHVAARLVAVVPALQFGLLLCAG